MVNDTHTRRRSRPAVNQRGAVSRLYLVRPVRRSNPSDYQGLHGLDQHQHRSETFEVVDMRQGQNAEAEGQLSLFAGFRPSHNRAEHGCGSFILFL